MFLAEQPQDWCHDEAYQRGRELIKALCVEKDTAERGVKLFEEYNQLITRDEEKQLLLQVAEANTKAIPTETTKRLQWLRCRTNEQFVNCKHTELFRIE